MLREASSEVHINDHWWIPTRHTLLLAELEASGGDIDVKEVTRLVDQVKAVLPTSVPQTIRDHADVIIAEASLARISHLDVSRSELESLLRDAESLVTRLLPESSQGLPNHLSNSTDQLLPRVLTIKGESKLRWALAVRRQARVRQGLLAQASEALNQALEILETSGGAPGLYSDGAPLSYWRRPWERSWRRVADMAVFVELELRRGYATEGSQPSNAVSQAFRRLRSLNRRLPSFARIRKSAAQQDPGKNSGLRAFQALQRLKQLTYSDAIAQMGGISAEESLSPEDSELLRTLRMERGQADRRLSSLREENRLATAAGAGSTQPNGVATSLPDPGATDREVVEAEEHLNSLDEQVRALELKVEERRRFLTRPLWMPVPNWMPSSPS